MSHKGGRVTLQAWVEPALRDRVRLEAQRAGLEFSRYVSRVLEAAADKAAQERRDLEDKRRTIKALQAGRGGCDEGCDETTRTGEQNLGKPEPH